MLQSISILRKVVIFTLVPTYWISNTQIIVETNTSEYALIAIYLIMTEEKEIHPVTFYFYTFKATELNYNMYNKELLIVFKVFHIWHHYLEELELFIDIIMDYKNLEYFLTTKILFYHQAR